MIKQLGPGFRLTVILTILTGLLYPAVMTGVSELIFPKQANGSLITVNLTNVSNAQVLTIHLPSVTDGTRTSNIDIPMGVLLGDTTNSRVVNASDVSQTKTQSGTFVTHANFRTDVTANGAINSSDVAQVKAQSGTALP